MTPKLQATKPTDVMHPPERKVVFDTNVSVPYNSTVKLQSTMDAHLFYDGQVSGRHYEWAKAGSIEAVEAEDAPALLEKRIVAQSCCNGSNNAVFIKID